MRPPIHSKKHYVQVTLSSVLNGAIANEKLGTSKEGAPSAPGDIKEGALVKAVYVEMWLAQASSSVGSFTAGLYLTPDGTELTASGAAALHDSSNKNNILYVTQGLSPANNVQLMPLIRQWIKIPKGKQRRSLGSKIVFFIRNNNGADDINYCGFATYKEYT